MKKIKNDSELLKKRLEKLEPFKLYFYNEKEDTLDDDGIYEYSEEDGCYHQKNTGWFSIDIKSMLRAIVDDDYFISLEVPND